MRSSFLGHVEVEHFHLRLVMPSISFVSIKALLRVAGFVLVAKWWTICHIPIYILCFLQ